MAGGQKLPSLPMTENSATFWEGGRSFRTAHMEDQLTRAWLKQPLVPSTTLAFSFGGLFSQRTISPLSFSLHASAGMATAGGWSWMQPMEHLISWLPDKLLEAWCQYCLKNIGPTDGASEPPLASRDEILRWQDKMFGPQPWILSL
ncbi:hypothetical protein H112_04545 [Trichophyton rubrum D6]|uniref:Uncharacterized protein n=3 Tax=Trichophyton TaxID=5550 RepID=F2SN06_TRIRC|nr:uncharacterized protein TERG_04318 [Trichophyton rubrum CBS 118892]EZF22628.1 hypothetical protein H100_04552 [Trichophyton rubrum MR850]EZF41747.1 hypothetical protein H102_04539 [Trichophyton rubrum CBS 100081]EZF52344.1 hypothetical protein H103_04547 [Trichophyton rubrum CBS 288.86]EZF62928.1 hypothetical protein H104_04535 [Trichophyton rubrum CBS 289.86]EZF73500.1 hypothetical protein H105_04562 [Trichophyton soudanense CBS 452.61]EZF84253.1 hypothetical protein H110_04539 [Trichophy